jgi:hypothetical protein
MFFVPGVCDLRRGQFLLYWTLLVRLSQSHRNQNILNPFTITSKWQLPSNHRKYSIDMFCSSRSWEFPSCFHTYPLCGQHRQEGLKAVPFLVQQHCF